MARRKKSLPAKEPANEHPEHRDTRPTAGDVKEHGFENTTWEQHTHHDAGSTEAERKNTGRTLPDSAAKDKQ